MDDATTPTDPYMVATGRKSPGDHRPDERVGPAAVVFTMNNSHAQEFTSDRRLLPPPSILQLRMRGNPSHQVLGQRPEEVLKALRTRLTDATRLCSSARTRSAPRRSTRWAHEMQQMADLVAD